MIQAFYTYGIALVGVGVFLWLNIPLPWLLGPIFACLVAALLGVPMRGFKLLNETMRTILGVAVGATFTPVLLASMVGMIVGARYSVNYRLTADIAEILVAEAETKINGD